MSDIPTLSVIDAMARQILGKDWRDVWVERGILRDSVRVAIRHECGSCWVDDFADSLWSRSRPYHGAEFIRFVDGAACYCVRRAEPCRPSGSRCSL